ncbi:MAG: pseudouridine synthase [Candidatus Eisenbacteria bacterium]
MSTRLNKLLAERGIGARRKCDEIIQAGRVRVNGVTVNEPGTQVEEGRDKVTVDGRPLQGRSKLVYYVINKPVGVITTLDDPHGRRTIAEFLPRGARVFPVGRLDADTSGLLLLTNDGELANKLMHPRYGVEKFYRVRLDREPSKQQIERLKRGVRFDEGLVSAPARVRRIDPGFEAIMLEVAIHEGRFRQVRKMCEAVGLTVTGLHRVGYGPIRLGPLARGMFRELSDDEVARLQASSGRTKDAAAVKYKGPEKRGTSGVVPGSGMTVPNAAPTKVEAVKSKRRAPEPLQAEDVDDEDFEELWIPGGGMLDLESEDEPARMIEGESDETEAAEPPTWPIRPGGKRGDAAWLAKQGGPQAFEAGEDDEETDFEVATPVHPTEPEPEDEGDALREAFAPSRPRGPRPGSRERRAAAAAAPERATKRAVAAPARSSRSAHVEAPVRSTRPAVARATRAEAARTERSAPARSERPARSESPTTARSERPARTERPARREVLSHTARPERRSRREEPVHEEPARDAAPERQRGDAKRDRKRGPGPRPNAGRGEKHMREGRISGDRPFGRFERVGARPDPTRGAKRGRGDFAPGGEHRDAPRPKAKRGAFATKPEQDASQRRGARTSRGGVSARDYTPRADKRAAESARIERWYGPDSEPRTRRPGDTRAPRGSMMPKARVEGMERERRRNSRDTSGPGTTTKPRREVRPGGAAPARGARSGGSSAGRLTQRDDRAGATRAGAPRRGAPSRTAGRPPGRPEKRGGKPRH